MYDIYLDTGCKFIPDLTDLLDTIPELGKNEFQQRLLSNSPKFLGLNLPIEIARKLIRRLKYTDSKARGMIIPIKYRDNSPKLTSDDAFSIAKEAMREKQGKYPDVVFGEIVHDSIGDTLMYFTFVSSSRKWLEEGLIPGALFVHIDKIDGHVWTSEEHMIFRDDLE